MFATRNKCIASSNKCLTSSNKCIASRNKCPPCDRISPRSLHRPDHGGERRQIATPQGLQTPRSGFAGAAPQGDLADLAEQLSVSCCQSFQHGLHKGGRKAGVTMAHRQSEQVEHGICLMAKSFLGLSRDLSNPHRQALLHEQLQDMHFIAKAFDWLEAIAISNKGIATSSRNVTREPIAIRCY